MKEPIDEAAEEAAGADNVTSPDRNVDAEDEGIGGKAQPSTNPQGLFRDRIFLAMPVLLPVWYVIYAHVALRHGVSAAGVFDAVAFVALISLVTVLLSRFKSAWLRYALFCSLSLLLSIFFIGNTIFYRVLNRWIYYDIVIMWRSVSPVVEDTLETLSAWDWTAGLVAPALLACLLARKRREEVRGTSYLAVAAVLSFAIFAHATLKESRAFRPADHNLVMNIGREWFLHTFLPPKLELKPDVSIWDYYPKPVLDYELDSNPQYPLLKIPTAEPDPEPLIPIDKTRPPNIVLVMMESVRALESGAYGAEPSFTPELDKLAGDGMRFHNFYANGSQTARGELALLCSFYPNSTDAMVYRLKPEMRISSLPGILRQRGYRTLWISGASKNYQNKHEFLSKHGVTEFHDQHGMPPDTPKIGWGSSDEEIFKYAERILDRQTEPFFAEITTLSNHWDFQNDYPTASQTPKVVDNKRYVGYTRGIYYTDWAIGRFMERMRVKPYFENTIFVFVADHGIWLFPSDPALEPVQKQEAYFRMPLIIYAPALIEPAVVEVVGSQVDFAPTMLHLLGVRERNSFVGRSLLAEESESERYALMHLVRLWNLRVGNRYIYDVGVEGISAGYPLHTLWGRNHKKIKTHANIVTDADLLRGWDPDSIRLGDSAEGMRHEEWATDLLKFNSFFLREDRLFDWPYLSSSESD